MKIEGQTTRGIERAIPAIGHRKSYKVTGAVAIASTFIPRIAWQLESICIHLSAAGAAGDLTATIDHNAGSAFDVVILTQDMTSVVDLVWQPDRPMEFSKKDQLDIAWANGSTRTYGLEIAWKER